MDNSFKNNVLAIANRIRKTNGLPESDDVNDAAVLLITHIVVFAQGKAHHFSITGHIEDSEAGIGAVFLCFVGSQIILYIEHEGIQLPINEVIAMAGKAAFHFLGFDKAAEIIHSGMEQYKAIIREGDQELELAILQRYVEHHDAVGMQARKCARELDMKEVISTAIGEPANEVVVQRWHSRLAPPSPPYPPGVLRPCSASTVNKGPHRFYARAYFEKGKAPAWDRIAELRNQLPQESTPQKEKEQKFGILNSLRQATPDFALYSSGLNIDVSVGVLFIDIDNFKSLNTRFTESTVDQQILIPFQQLLSSICLYRGDAYRHGGEEFLVLLPNHTAGEVTQFAERLRGKIDAEEFSVTDISVQITASIGIALWPQHGSTLDDLIARANRAEHEAKEKGRNRIEVYKEST